MRDLVEGKRRWSSPPKIENLKHRFRGWNERGYLPLATRWAVLDSRSLPAKRLAISSAHDIDALRKVIRP